MSYQRPRSQEYYLAMAGESSPEASSASDDIDDEIEVLEMSKNVTWADADDQETTQNPPKSGQVEDEDEENWDLDDEPGQVTSSKLVDLNDSLVFESVPPALLPDDFQVDDETINNNKIDFENFRMDNLSYDEILFALQMGDLKEFSYLIDGFADQLDVNKEEFSGWPLLFIAIDHGKPEIVNYLIQEKGAKADIIEKDENLSSLMIAAASSAPEQQIIEILKILIENKADINATTPAGRTCLHFAVVNNRPRVIDQLVDHGALIDVQIKTNTNIFEWAVSFGFGSAISTLFKRKCQLDPNFKSFEHMILSRGFSLSEYAVSIGFLELGIVLFKMEKENWRLEFNESEVLNELANCNCHNTEENDSLYIDSESRQIKFIISGLGFKQYSDTFKNYNDLLLTDKTKMRDLGIKEIGIRSKILRNVRKILNRSWSSCTIPFDPDKLSITSIYNTIEAISQQMVHLKTIINLLCIKTHVLSDDHDNGNDDDHDDDEPSQGQKRNVLGEEYIERKKRPIMLLKEIQVITYRERVEKMLLQYEQMDRELRQIITDLRGFSSRADMQLGDKIESQEYRNRINLRKRLSFVRSAIYYGTVAYYLHSKFF